MPTHTCRIEWIDTRKKINALCTNCITGWEVHSSYPSSYSIVYSAITIKPPNELTSIFSAWHVAATMAGIRIQGQCCDVHAWKQKAYSMQCKALADDHKWWPNIFCALYGFSAFVQSLYKVPTPISTSLIRRVFTLVFVAVPRCYLLQVTNTGMKSPG